MTDKTDKTATDSGYVVTAPYITVRVKDDLGNPVITGFYKGGVLPDDVHEDDVDRHLEKNMIAEQGSKEAEGVSPVGERVQFDDLGNPMSREQIAAAEEKRQSRASRTTAAAKPEPKSGRQADKPES